MDNYLILGANGLIGRSVSKQIEGKYNWFGTYHKRCDIDLTQIDITLDADIKRIFELSELSNPSHIINCTNLAGGVNFCEKNPLIAKKFHLDSVTWMCKLANKHSSKLVMISTDYIFDGGNIPYKEDDETNPLNLYGSLKLRAEKQIIENANDYLIIRTTNVFGWDPNTVTPNYMMQLYKSMSRKKEFNAPSFLWGNPTYVDNLTSAIVELCKKNIKGIFHVVGSSFINRYDWALKFCEKGGFDKSLIKEVKETPKDIVPRPLKSNLSTDKFHAVCNTTLHDVDTGIDIFIEKMKISEDSTNESKHYGFNL